ncbi:uncharacterized protein LY79DRAFT_678339 [Colletotrichum navitas]|uniref:Uncharacterized protein n=1 Tax=Colletotrichum navitas TaxID=681940 RepID=A0AAD8UX55_9PEZI|nr:uncharacterized protein LY79DRAFT_678339 [Colletotrichum navitas]KAK1570090.1 hypothetical protein LY79DRAFT_678339 [Colletotrichum navitas]
MAGQVINIKRDVLIFVTNRSLWEEVGSIQGDVARRWGTVVKRQNASISIIALLFGKDIVSSRACATAVSQLPKLQGDMDLAVKFCSPGCWPTASSRALKMGSAVSSVYSFSQVLKSDEPSSIDKPEPKNDEPTELNTEYAAIKASAAAVTPNAPHNNSPEPIEPTKSPEVARKPLHRCLVSPKPASLGPRDLKTPRDTKQNVDEDDYSDAGLGGGLGYSDEEEDGADAIQVMLPIPSGNGEDVSTITEEELSSTRHSFLAITPLPSAPLLSFDCSYGDLSTPNNTPLKQVNLAPRWGQKRASDLVEELSPPNKAKKAKVTSSLDPPLRKPLQSIVTPPPDPPPTALVPASAPSDEHKGDGPAKAPCCYNLECVVLYSNVLIMNDTYSDGPKLYCSYLYLWF